MAHECRAGGKFTASHKSCIPAAAKLADIADGLTEVYKISLGVIKAGLPPSEQRLKIVEDGNVVLLQIRGVNSFQELRIFTRNMQATKLALARGARNNNFHIRFK